MYADKSYQDIVTIHDDPNLLRTPALQMNIKDYQRIQSTCKKLGHIRDHVLGGGAGLAAPQIGISEAIFIFTPDRTTANLSAAINPSYEPVCDEKSEGWEACFSVPLTAVNIKRYLKIKARYLTLEGTMKDVLLEGFAARVFQHETDHVNGCLTIDHGDAQIKKFNSSEEFINFMKDVHQNDAKTYTR